MIGAWMWLAGASAVGAAIGYFGFFGNEEGWSGALVGALIGLFAAAIQHLKDLAGTLGPRRAKTEPVPRTSVSPEGNRRILWRRSKRAKYARWLFFFGGLTSLFFGLLLMSGPEKFWEAMGYGLIPLGLLSIGVYKHVGARREIARAMAILERGVVGEARIVSLDREAIKDSRSPFEITLGWSVTYSYRDGRGALHQGTSGFLRRNEAERYQPGDVVMIVTDPTDPGFSVWAEQIVMRIAK